jgi:hypothetical protein
MEYICGAQVGTLEENITDITVHNRVSWLGRMILQYKQYQYNKTQNEEIRQCIKPLMT